jgi:hypothetical protein
MDASKDSSVSIFRISKSSWTESQDTATLKSVGNNAPMTERHPAEGW